MAVSVGLGVGHHPPRAGVLDHEPDAGRHREGARPRAGPADGVIREGHLERNTRSAQRQGVARAPVAVAVAVAPGRLARAGCALADGEVELCRRYRAALDAQNVPAE